MLEKQPSITAKQTAEALKISPRKVSRIIKELREKEVVVRIGSNKTGYRKIQHKIMTTSKTGGLLRPIRAYYQQALKSYIDSLVAKLLPAIP